MTKNLFHTEVERAQIVAFQKIGLSQRQISKQINIQVIYLKIDN